jgi:branched-subunit amino acid transport protein AzlD
MSGNRPVRISHSANKTIPKLLPFTLLVMLITYLLESVEIALRVRPTELALLKVLLSVVALYAWMDSKANVSFRTPCVFVRELHVARGAATIQPAAAAERQLAVCSGDH